MQDRFASIKKRMDSGIDSLLGYVIIAMVLIVGLQVFFRYVMKNPLPWPEEIARIMIVWLSFVGGYMALRDKKHVGFNILVDKLSDKARGYTGIVSDFLVAVFLAVVVIEGFKFAVKFASVPMSYTRIPTGKLVYSVFPVSGILMFLQSVLTLIDSVSKVFGKKAGA